MCIQPLVAIALLLSAWIPREEGLYRSQLHRGGGGQLPDNALETFLWCWGRGCTPEADGRLTKDGVAICMHDETFDRTVADLPAALKGKKAKELDFAEMRDLDIGSKWGPQFATCRVATMESVFAAMKGRPERLLYLDEKGAPPKLMAELSAAWGVQEQVIYTSPQWRRVAAWKKVAPQGRSMVWLGRWPRTNAPESIAMIEKYMSEQLDEMEAANFAGIDQVQLHIRTDHALPDPFSPSTPFIRRTVERLHRAGVIVNAGLFFKGGDEIATYLKLWDLGVDTFTSDYPDAMFEAIRACRRQGKGGKRE